MRLLLVNAKPTLADALADYDDVTVDLIWPRHHHFQGVPLPADLRAGTYHGGRKLNLQAAWQMRALINRLRPDIVHAFYGRALAHVVLASTALRHRPKIISFRGVTSPLSRWDAGDWLSYRNPLVDAHACESDAVRRALIASGIDSADAS